jgi:hypothetical protein
MATIFPGSAVAAAGSGEVKTVIAEGMGSGHDTAAARDAALADAQRRAVEQGVGLYLRADALVANLALVRDEIYRNAQGYVQSYCILDEGVTPDRLGYRVHIEAQVRTLALDGDLRGVAERLRLAGAPRVHIALTGSAYARTARDLLADHLLQQGFAVLGGDRLAASCIEGTGCLVSAPGGRSEQVERPDIAVTGTLAVAEPERLAGDKVVYRSRVTVYAEVLIAENGRTVTVIPGLGTAVAFTPEAAATAAVPLAVRDWAARNMTALVRAALDPCRSYRLEVRGCAPADAAPLTRMFGELRFVRRARLLESDAQRTHIELEFLGGVEHLATVLATVPGWRITLETIAPFSLRATCQKEIDHAP